MMTKPRLILYPDEEKFEWLFLIPVVLRQILMLQKFAASVIVLSAHSCISISS